MPFSYELAQALPVRDDGVFVPSATVVGVTSIRATGK
jgi:hypothetical protein